MNDSSPRTYRSPLREEQAQRTRNRVLDALVELLTERRADDITTREIAERAGVSQPTVYRHFPDRTALLEGISARLAELMTGRDEIPTVSVLDDLGPRIEAFFLASDEFPVEFRAEALMNADPRRYSPDTRQNSALVVDAVAASFPNLSEHQHAQVAGLLRCLGSSQSWLRMREEFGVPGSESGPLLHWAIDTLVAAIRDGQLPELGPADNNGGQP